MIHYKIVMLGWSNPLTELLRNSKHHVGLEMESVNFVENPITNSKDTGVHHPYPSALLPMNGCQ